MNIKKLINDTLSPLGLPVTFQKYSGDEATYITFFIYNEQGELWAENVEIATGFYFQVDIWSDVDYIILESQVTSTMIAAGFSRTTAADLYESETKIFHKAIRFSFIN